MGGPTVLGTYLLSMVLPPVAALDLAFAALAYLGYRKAPSGLTRSLCAALAVYCLIEMTLHVPMERLAGRVLWG